MRGKILMAFVFFMVLTALAVDDEIGFGGILEIRTVELDVIVSANGDRLDGLSVEDFVLMVDGHEVAIEGFDEIRQGSFAASDSSLVGESIGTDVLVFVDDLFAFAPRRNRVLDRLSEEVGELASGDRMAIVAFDGNRIDLLSPWTSSQSALREALELAIDRPAYGLRFALDDDWIGRGSYGLGHSAGRLGDPRALINDLGHEVGTVVEAASAALRGLPRSTNRKVALVLSSWPPILDRHDRFDRSRAWTTGERSVAGLVETANLLGYTLYPVDVRGDRSLEGFGAEVRSAAAARRTQARVGQDEWIVEGVLSHLARQSGGEAWLDNASLAALSKTLDDGRSYYRLSFTPDWLANDQKHRIEVELVDRKARVRTRRSFSDLSRSTAASLMIEGSQLFDMPLLADGGLEVELGNPSPAGWRKVTVPIEIAIPLDRLILRYHSKGWVSRLELRVAATDDRGDRSDIPVVPIELSGEEAPAEGESALFSTELLLRNRPHTLQLSIYDPASGVTLAERIEIQS